MPRPTYVKIAQSSANWLSGGCLQRQIVPHQAAPSFGQPRPISRLGHTLAGHTPAIPRPCFRDRLTYHGVGYMVYWLLRGWAVFAEEMTDWLDCGSCTHINNLAG